MHILQNRRQEALARRGCATGGRIAKAGEQGATGPAALMEIRQTVLELRRLLRIASRPRGWFDLHGYRSRASQIPSDPLFPV
jgi:hypothetical protein